MRARTRLFCLGFSASLLLMMPMGYNLDIGLAATTCCIITIHASVTLPSLKLKANREAGFLIRTLFCASFIFLMRMLWKES